MSYKAEVYKVLVASPSDLNEERIAANSVLQKLNYFNGYSEKKLFIPMMWENNYAPSLGVYLQETINRQFGNSCDLGISLFLTRMETPTANYVSGTVEEIERLLLRNKKVMAYFSDRPLLPSAYDSSYYDVMVFKNILKSRGIIGSFTSIEEFSRSLYDHISIIAREIIVHEFEDIEKDQDRAMRIGVVSIDDNGELIIDTETYKNIPLTYFEREILAEIWRGGSAQLGTLVKSYGKQPIKNIIKYGLVKNSNGKSLFIIILLVIL